MSRSAPRCTLPAGVSRRVMEQSIRYLKTSDGVRVAWASAGKGPTLIKTANWLTHLEYDLESPVWRHWIRFFADHFHFIRHDERGCGMTEWDVGDLSFPRWVEDVDPNSNRAGRQNKEPTGSLVRVSQRIDPLHDYYQGGL